MLGTVTSASSQSHQRRVFLCFPCGRKRLSGRECNSQGLQCPAQSQDENSEVLCFWSCIHPLFHLQRRTQLLREQKWNPAALPGPALVWPPSPRPLQGAPPVLWDRSSLCGIFPHICWTLSHAQGPEPGTASSVTAQEQSCSTAQGAQ